MLYQLMYFSIAEDGFCPDDLSAIVNVAEAANAENDLTGFLTFNGIEFLQFLEGPDVKVRGLMDRIEMDPRHHSVVTLASGRAQHRCFPNWAMQRLPDAPARASADATVHHDLFAVAEVLQEPFRRAYLSFLRG